MKRIRLQLPKKLNSIRSIYETGVCTTRLDGYDQAILDCSKCLFAEPFPLVYLAFKIKELQKSYPNTHWYVEGYRSSFASYANHVGFFEFLNIEAYSSRSDPHKVSKSLIPMQIWSIPNLVSEAEKEPVGALIDVRSRELASVLLQDDSGQVYETLQYSIREIARNAVEHSKGQTAIVMGQYWPKSKRAEIVVFDDGIGIAENIYENEHVDVSNNLAALKVSLLPGISGVSRAIRGAQDDIWRNSGFGLYVVSRLAAKFGKFCIVSKDDYIELNHKRQYNQKYPLAGTAVCLNIQIDEASNSSLYIRRLIEDGDKARSEIMGNHPIKASEASKMLLSDFERI